MSPRSRTPTKAKTSAAETAPAPPSGGHEWVLRLYVAGHSPRSVTAVANLKKICEQHLAGKYAIEIIDLLEHPQLSREDQIVAIPTVVRKLPPPLSRVIGDLSDTEGALIGLQLRPAASKGVKK